MQRIVLVLAFTLGFTGVIALAAGWSTPPASQADGRTNDTWISLPANPSHTSFGTLMPDGTYRGVVSPDEDGASAASQAGDASHPSFGTRMPDGTYCGVGCPSWDANP